ncbi:MAG: nucleoside triphosphate pyrophosphatase [Wenzhouxiangellaceae bacterium]
MPRTESGLILASASPRRLELLRQVGFEPVVAPAAIDETPLPAEQSAAYVVRIAGDKAAALAAQYPMAVVLAADTTVVVDGQMLHKPADEAAALAMLQQLSGREHLVLTAVCIRRGDWQRQQLVSTEVRFRPLSQAEMKAYAATGEPMDKAGAYAIQGRAALFVSQLRGSYSAVVGLPLCETAMLLQEAGLQPW